MGNQGIFQCLRRYWRTECIHSLRCDSVTIYQYLAMTFVSVQISDEFGGLNRNIFIIVFRWIPTAKQWVTTPSKKWAIMWKVFPCHGLLKIEISKALWFHLCNISLYLYYHRACAFEIFKHIPFGNAFLHVYLNEWSGQVSHMQIPAYMQLTHINF